jgi:hypothetical protein
MLTKEEQRAARRIATLTKEKQKVARQVATLTEKEQRTTRTSKSSKRSNINQGVSTKDY